jgi:Transposase DDE domain
MRTSHYPRLSRLVQDHATTTLLRRLRPRDFSEQCSASTLLRSLIFAAAACISLAAVAALWTRGPCRETLRQALLTTLPDYTLLRRKLPGLLRASLPRRLRKRRCSRRYPLIIDLHSVPYYKRGRTPPEHVRKGQRVAGTSYLHQYATANLLCKGQYYVVALTPFDAGENKATVVRRLLRQAAANGFSPRYVLMDRGFWAAEVFRYLQRARYPFLIPVLGRGKKATTPGGPTGTRVFYHGHKTGFYSYRVTERRDRLSARLTIVVHRRNWGGRSERHGRYVWAYGMWGMQLSKIQWVHECYRRRFRIESSYRLLEAARARTSSRNEGTRLWYVLLAVLMLNAWLQLRRQMTSQHGGCSEAHWYGSLLKAMIWLLLLQSGTTDDPTAQANPKQSE